MKATVQIILLILFNALLVFESCIECMSTSLDKEVKQDPGTDTLLKRNYPHRQKQLCGRTKVTLTPVRREINGLDQNGDYSEDETIDDLLDKILGGSNTTYGEIPWIATILYDNEHYCGGAIINEFWILSAAHCFYGLEEHYADFNIVVGDHRLKYTDAYEEIFDVKTVVVHNQFPFDEYAYDVVLVKIKAKSNGRGIRFNNHVQPICLANSGESLQMNSLMLISGWGHTSTANEKAPTLKKAFLPNRSPTLCTEIYGPMYSVTAICAGSMNDDIDLCSGDSGGPAVYKHGDFYIIYGVVKGGTGCGLPNYPVVLMNVATLRDWIDGTIRQYSSDSEKIMPVRN